MQNAGLRSPAFRSPNAMMSPTGKVSKAAAAGSTAPAARNVVVVKHDGAKQQSTATATNGPPLPSTTSAAAPATAAPRTARKAAAPSGSLGDLVSPRARLVTSSVTGYGTSKKAPRAAAANSDGGAPAVPAPAPEAALLQQQLSELVAEKDRLSRALGRVTEEYVHFREATAEAWEAHASRSAIAEARHAATVGVLSREGDSLLRHVLALEEEKEQGAAAAAPGKKGKRAAKETAAAAAAPAPAPAPAPTPAAAPSSTLVPHHLVLGSHEKQTMEAFAASLTLQVAALQRALIEAEARAAVSASAAAAAAAAATSSSAQLPAATATDEGELLATYESFLLAIGEGAVVEQARSGGVVDVAGAFARGHVGFGMGMMGAETPEGEGAAVAAAAGPPSSPAAIPQDQAFAPAPSSSLIDLPLSPAGGAASSSGLPTPPFARAAAAAQRGDPRAAPSPVERSSGPSHARSRSGTSSLSTVPDRAAVLKILEDALLVSSGGGGGGAAGAHRSATTASSSSSSSYSSRARPTATAATAAKSQGAALAAAQACIDYYADAAADAEARAVRAEGAASEGEALLVHLRAAIAAHQAAGSRHLAEREHVAGLLASAMAERDEVRALNARLVGTARKAEGALKGLAAAHSALRKGVRGVARQQERVRAVGYARELLQLLAKDTVTTETLLVGGGAGAGSATEAGVGALDTSVAGEEGAELAIPERAVLVDACTGTEAVAESASVSVSVSEAGVGGCPVSFAEAGTGTEGADSAPSSLVPVSRAIPTEDACVGPDEEQSGAWAGMMSPGAASAAAGGASPSPATAAADSLRAFFSVFRGGAGGAATPFTVREAEDEAADISGEERVGVDTVFAAHADQGTAGGEADSDAPFFPSASYAAINADAFAASPSVYSVASLRSYRSALYAAATPAMAAFSTMGVVDEGRGGQEDDEEEEGNNEGGDAESTTRSPASAASPVGDAYGAAREGWSSPFSAAPLAAPASSPAPAANMFEDIAAATVQALFAAVSIKAGKTKQVWAAASPDALSPFPLASLAATVSSSSTSAASTHSPIFSFAPPAAAPAPPFTFAATPQQGAESPAPAWTLARAPSAPAPVQEQVPAATVAFTPGPARARGPAAAATAALRTAAKPAGGAAAALSPSRFGVFFPIGTPAGDAAFAAASTASAAQRAVATALRAAGFPSVPPGTIVGPLARSPAPALVGFGFGGGGFVSATPSGSAGPSTVVRPAPSAPLFTPSPTTSATASLYPSAFPFGRVKGLSGEAAGAAASASASAAPPESPKECFSDSRESSGSGEGGSSEDGGRSAALIEWGADKENIPPMLPRAAASSGAAAATVSSARKISPRAAQKQAAVEAAVIVAAPPPAPLAGPALRGGVRGGLGAASAAAVRRPVFAARYGARPRAGTGGAATGSAAPAASAPIAAAVPSAAASAAHPAAPVAVSAPAPPSSTAASAARIRGYSVGSSNSVSAGGATTSVPASRDTSVSSIASRRSTLEAGATASVAASVAAAAAVAPSSRRSSLASASSVARDAASLASLLSDVGTGSAAVLLTGNASAASAPTPCAPLAAKGRLSRASSVAAGGEGAGAGAAGLSIQGLLSSLPCMCGPSAPCSGCGADFSRAHWRHRHCASCAGAFCAGCSSGSSGNHRLLENTEQLPKVCAGCAGGMLLSGTLDAAQEAALAQAMGY
jgi:hypothetical protein